MTTIVRSTLALAAALLSGCTGSPEAAVPPPAAPQPPAPTPPLGGMVSGGEYGCGAGAPLFALVLRDSTGGEYASVAIDTLRLRLQPAGEGRFASAAGDTLRLHGDSATFVQRGATRRCAKTAG